MMQHEWFKEYDWDGLVNATKEPPWRPSLKACDDTTCFDDASSGDSLDGPSGKSHAEDLVKKWASLQQEYTGSEGKIVDMSHLTGEK